MSRLPTTARGYYPIKSEGVTLDRIQRVKRAFKKAERVKDQNILLESTGDLRTIKEKRAPGASRHRHA